MAGAILAFMGNLGWGPLLKRWSEEWLEARRAEDPDVFEDLDDAVVRDRWLGFEPAGAEAVSALEERIRGLGIDVPLPPSLRGFLEMTDGWRYAGGSVYLLAGAADIGPYGDPLGQQAVYEEYLDADPPEEDVRLVGMWGRALQLSLDSDLTDVLLDPGDVGADGEWAVYVHRGWSGERPGRYASFRAFMEAMYQEFYRLGGDHSGFENRVTRDLDSRVDEARLACLRGELDDALDVFREAGELGRPRAGLLAAQLRTLLGEGGGWVPVDPRMDDPLYAGEVLPLKALHHVREGGQRDDLVLGPVTEDYATDRERAAAVLARIRERTYEYASPGPSGARSSRPGSWRAGATRTAPGGCSRRRSRAGNRTGTTMWRRSACSATRCSARSSHRNAAGNCSPRLAPVRRQPRPPTGMSRSRWWCATGSDG